MSNPKFTRNPDMEAMYRRLRSSLMRYASRYFRRPQEIEDVVQETFVRVIEAQQTRGTQVNDSYFFRTTRNLALNRLDRCDHRLTDTVGDLLDQTVIQDSPSLEEQFESRERFELFCRAVRELPVKCRRVFVLRRVYGLSHKEIAEHMGISVKTVEVHLTKAIVRCTDYMEAAEREGGASAGSDTGKGATRHG
jgi:RNA polymerase sigma-70 factor (family 1)